MDTALAGLREQVESDWDRFVAGLGDASALRPLIQESWERCRAAGVDPGQTPLHRVPEPELERRLRAGAGLLAAARPHLDWLSATLAGLPHVLYLTDADGIVLLSTGSAPELQRDAGLTPGHDWSEARMGTNGAGTALATGRPAAVVGPEHYARAFQGCTCTAAPIRGPDGAVLAALDLTTPEIAGVPGRLTLVAYAAWIIERELAAATDITGCRRAGERVRMLYELTAALGGALGVEEIAEVVVSRILAAVGADGGSLVVLDPDGAHVRIVKGMGYDEEANRRWLGVPVPLAEPMPVTDPVRTGEPVELASLAEWRARYPHLAAYHQEYGFQGIAVVPCPAGGRVLGAIALSFREPRVLSGDERAVATALGQQCGQALDRARAYEAERRARAEAEEANRAKASFLAVTSHELRTPLNAILGYADLLDAGVHGPLTDAQRPAVHRLRESARRLLGLIDTLLAFARIEAGQVEWHVTDHPVAATLTAVEAVVAPLVAAGGLSYASTAPDAGLRVRADAEKLEQVLLNLVTNAIKFTPAGGAITVAAEACGESVAMRVRDTGVGIPPDRIARIFEPFVQVGAHRAHSRGGVGLGLAISRDLARGMGGDLSVESEEGVGTTFTLTLPRARP